MPQQINLCTPILLTPKRYFSAQTMVQALVIFVGLGGVLCAYWVWSLNTASEGFKNTVSMQSHELEGLQSAIKQSKLGGAPAEAQLTQEIQGQRAELSKREKLLHELRRGLFQPSWGHAARLQLVAESIPKQVWVTELKADDDKLEVSGFTLEPSALNDWVAKLAVSPLLEGQKLSTVKVEDVTTSMVKEVSSAVAPAKKLIANNELRQVWFFNLVSSVGKPLALVGGKP